MTGDTKVNKGPTIPLPSTEDGDGEAVNKSGEGDEPDWKSYVAKRKDAAPDYPTVSKFQKDDTVWVVDPGTRGVVGPCIVVAVLGGETYRVRETAKTDEWTASGEHLSYRI